MMPVTLFLVSFAAGPALFWLLARQTPSGSYFAALCFASTLLIVSAFVMTQSFGTGSEVGFVILIMIWIGWIMVVSLAVLALRSRDAKGTTPRFAFAIGAMATTLPWFGLFTATTVWK